MREILAQLTAPFPKDKIKSRVAFTNAKGEEVSVPYVEWHTVVDRLEEVVPGQWEYIIQDVKLIDRGQDGPSTVIVHASMIIMGCRKDGIGTHTTAKIYEKAPTPQNPYAKKFVGWGYLDDLTVKAAESDTLKRVAIKHGIGLELYRDKPRQAATSRPRPVAQPQQIVRPLAGTTGWQAAVIPFGQKSGMKLGQLSKKDLVWWKTSWFPRPNNKGDIPRESISLREALDSITDKELESMQ